MNKQCVYIDIPSTLKTTSRTIGNKYILFESDEMGFSIYLTKEKSPEEKSLMMYSSWKVSHPELKDKIDQDIQTVAQHIVDSVVQLHFAAL